MTVRVGIVGGTGYAGGELMRILSQHPEAQVVYAASRTQAGQPVAATHPGLSGIIDLEYEPIDAAVMAERCDVVFLAVPHGASLPLAAELLPTGVRVIDIGSDFRFRDPAEYERWYGREHGRPELLKDAVYGLPELHREELRTARLVANPGCYPTSVILAIAPFVAAGAVETRSVTVASMSGVSGAGSTPGPMYHLPEATENVRAYGVPGHRHTGEMEQGIRTLLERRAGDDPLAGNLLRDLKVSFVPHLVPMSRGILSTLNLELRAPLTTETALYLLREHYREEPFVRVLGADRLPQTKAVYGSNFCDVTARVDPRTERLIVLSAIDNLVKGAAGQAVQNMNILFGLDETLGLRAPGLYP